MGAAGSMPFTEEKRELLKGQVIQLRSQGFSYRKVAVKLNISHVEAFNLQREALKEIRTANAGLTEEYRELELNRCDELLDVLAGRLDVALNNGDDEKINKNLELVTKVQRNVIMLRQLDGSSLNISGELGSFAVKREQRSNRLVELLQKAKDRKKAQQDLLDSRAKE